MRLLLLLGCATALGCVGVATNEPGEDGHQPASPSDDGGAPETDGGSSSSDGGVLGQTCVPTKPVHDQLSATRQLRRVYLALAGVAPPAEKYEALAATEKSGQQAFLDAEIDALLAKPTFYEHMLRVGLDFVGMPRFRYATGDGYNADFAGHLRACGGMTAHAGALHVGSEPEKRYPGKFPYGSSQYESYFCNDTSLPAQTVEPWWAPGTTVDVVGWAASGVKTVPGKDGKDVECDTIVSIDYYNGELLDGCGCGPNLTSCSPLNALAEGGNDYTGHPRQPFEEPMRLFAHLAWYDKPLDNLVTGNFSVAPNWLRGMYVRQGRLQGAPALTTKWWKPSGDTSLRDPLHPLPDDPGAWREFVVESLNPFWLADRTYTYNPTTTKLPPRGLPAAGVLTMIGPLTSHARERVRAARFMEMFACHDFVPPEPGVSFSPYADDPANGGPCQHCHKTLDPVAIHFKRFDVSAGYNGYLVRGYPVSSPAMPGIGTRPVTKDMLSLRYPYNDGAEYRWATTFLPKTVLTPVTQAQIDENPAVIFIDSLDANTPVYGATSDGTIGPLGFGKILIASGAFDRCMSQRFYERIIGRKLDLANESRTIDALSTEFVRSGRKVRPFLKFLMQQPEFKRGL